MASSTSKSLLEKKVAKSIQPLTFPELEADGRNYLKWCIDVKAYLVVDDLEGILNYSVPDNFTTSQKSWALVFMRKHIDDSLEQQYLQIEDPTNLWRQLEATFCHKILSFCLRHVMIGQTSRFMIFSDFSSYNNELFKTVSQLHLCGEDKTDENMIENTISTFPTVVALLARMYWTMKFQTYCELTQFLLLAEQQQQLLLKNNESKPPREANATEIPTRMPEGGWKSNQQKSNRTPYSKPNNKSYNPSSGFGSRSSNQSNQSGSCKCFKCGRNGHMQKECRTSECKKCGRPGHLTHD
jgi:hypothetical protein